MNALYNEEYAARRTSNQRSGFVGESRLRMGMSRLATVSSSSCRSKSESASIASTGEGGVECAERVRSWCAADVRHLKGYL
jgi:hypothetical protein